MSFRKISSIVERLYARYLYVAGGAVILFLFIAISTADTSDNATLWMLGAVVSACIFFAILILKIAYYFIVGTVSATKETLGAIKGRKLSPKDQRKKNIPLIVVGIVILVASTPFVGSGGAFIPLLQVLGLIVILAGFGVPFTRPPQKKDSVLLSTTRDTTKAILSSFMELVSAYNLPTETPQDKLTAYRQVLSLRPGYTNDTIDLALNQAQELSDVWGETKGTSLNALIFILILNEYPIDTGKQIPTEQFDSIRKEIEKTAHQLSNV